MANFVGTTTYGIIATYSPSSEELTKALERTNHIYQNVYTAGTGSFQCDSYFTDEATFSGIVTYDTQALVDKFGTTLTLSKIKAFCIINKQGATGENMTISGDWFTTIFGGSHVIGPGGIVVAESPIDGFTVTDPTADGITVTTSGSFKHQIFIAGLD